MSTYTSLDLFCGAGGITEGMRSAGWTCVFANDFDSEAIKTFAFNHRSVETSADSIESLDPAKIRKSLGLQVGELDAVVGGSPCQGFSINAPERFLDDPRNNLFREYVRFLQEFKPKLFVFENVPGILSLGSGDTFQEICRTFQGCGYEIDFKVLYAPHYGVPQTRYRMIVLGSRIGPAPFHPRPSYDGWGRANFTGGRHLTFQPNDAVRTPLLPAVTVREAIHDLPALANGDGAEVSRYDRAPSSNYAKMLRGDCDELWNHVAPQLSAVNLERMKHVPIGGNWTNIPHHLLPKGMQMARRSDHTKRYGRLDPEAQSGTVLTKMDPHWGAVIHYAQDRALSVREAARLQSFPDQYRFLGSRVEQYRQVGNAVPPLLAQAIAEQLTEALAGRGFGAGLVRY